MTTVLLIAHLLIAAGLVAVILMQRSEGGALGIGGGGPGGMMTGRSAANLLTRVTMFLGAAFVINSILLAVVGGISDRGDSIIGGNNGNIEDLTAEDLFGNLGENEDGEGDTPEENLLPEATVSDDEPEFTIPEEDEPEEPQIPG